VLCVSFPLGCTVHEPGFDDPIAPPEAFVESIGGDEVVGNEEAVEPAPAEWWRAFDDASLNELQAAALDRNFDLATFRDRLRAAQAVVERERSSLFPSLDYDAFGQQTRRESNNFDGENLFGGSLVGFYEADVWNRIGAQVSAVEFDRLAAREQLKAAAITLSADVALTWYALVEQRGQARVLEQQIETNEKVLEVVRARFGGGVVRASDVLRQERLLESTREQRVVVRAQIDVLEHALLVLIGRSPTRSLAVEAEELPMLPSRPALGLPAELMRRRPDVRAAFFQIRAADRAVAAAVADRYPRVTLGLDASTSAEQIADLFDDWAATLSVDIFGPIFDAGRRAADVERTEAAKAERVNEYAQTVLVAFQQVVDALSRESAGDEQIRRIERQLELANRTTERLNREYLNGDIPYIDVLDALTTEQQLQRDLLRARFERIGDRIALYQALAGGWPGILPEAASGEQHAANGEPTTSTR
jgi:NodT family efflux transporter outer membrane factor (OMF) lipoprotein